MSDLKLMVKILERLEPVIFQSVTSCHELLGRAAQDGKPGWRLSVTSCNIARVLSEGR
jgi:hypothetical protein